MKYRELQKALLNFRQLFVKRYLPNSAVNGNEVFLRSVVQKDEWTQAEALRIYNIIKPHALLLKRINFDFNNVPKIGVGSGPVKKSGYKLNIPKQKLIGYDKEQFVVTFPYDRFLYEEIKKVPGSRWIMERKYWHVPLASNISLKAFAKAHQFKLTEKGRAMLDNITDNYAASYKAEKVELNIDFKLALYPFQSAGVDYGIKNRQVIFGDEMGLGKTPEGIGVVLGLTAFPCIVICPKSLRLNWQNEIHKFTHKKAVIIDKKIIRNVERYHELGVADYFITNFEGAKTYFADKIIDVEVTEGKRAGTSYKKVTTNGLEKAFKSFILDEAHECRNRKTLRFKCIKPIAKACEVRLALTGSPIVKGTADLAALLELIGRIDDFGGYHRFIRSYNRMNSETFNGKMLPANLKELNIKLRSLCFIRREKYQVLKELPDKIRQIINIEIDNRKEYDQALNAFRFWMIQNNYDEEKIDRAMRAELLVKIGTLKRLSAKGKLSAFSEFVGDVIDSGEKLIIFCWFKDTANYIVNNFDDVLLISGDVSDNEVEMNKHKFQTDNKYKLIVVTYKRGGVGHTLTAASKVAFIELGWTYKDQSQAEDRAHRIGQENAVNCYYFIGIDTLDQGIYDVIEQRRIMEREATGGTTEVKVNISKFLAKQIMNTKSDETNTTDIQELG